MRDSDEAAAKIVAVIVAGLVAVAGIGYIAYSLGGSAIEGDADDADATASSDADGSGSDDTASDGPSGDGSDDLAPVDDLVDPGDNECEIDCGDEDGSDGGDGGDGECETDCGEEEDEGVAVIVEPMDLYLGATSDDCDEDLLLSTEIGATLVESCKKVTSGHSVNMRFDSEANGMMYLNNTIFEGEIYLKINYVPGVIHAFKIQNGNICDGTIFTYTEQAFDYDELAQTEDGFRIAQFYGESDFDYSSHADHYDACNPFTKVRTNVASSSIEFRFDPDVPSFTNVSVADST